MDSLSSTGSSFSSTLTSPRSGGSPASVSSMPRRAVRAGDIGFLAKEAVQQGIDKRHHLKTHSEIGVGIAEINAQKVNNFINLPGLTFNEKSFASYISTASAMRRTMQQQAPVLRGSSPRKAAGGHY